MRTVLQRQAQLGEFEYLYSDTVVKPRWQLIMHQLSQNVASRRIIVELHSEWGLPTSFFADVAQLRALYEPIGCRVTLGTVLRHPIAWYLSLFNWRASNTIPLCQWQPPADGISRQVSGYALPFTRAGPIDRDRWNPPALSVSILAQFDVVGLTEMLDESLLLLADKAGLQRLGYSTLAANNKPEHPAKAKALLKALLAQVGATLSEPFTPLPPADSAEYAAAYEGARDIASGAALGWGAAEWEAHRRREAQSEWGGAALGAIAALNQVSMVYVERGKNKADCNFYPCEEGLQAAKGVWSRQLCPTDQGGLGSARELLRKMLNRTTADRAVHAYVVRRLRKQLAESAGGAARLAERMQQLKRDSSVMAARRLEAVGPGNRKLCGVHLCDKSARRSCVSCPADPVPALESCWPSWEDQFSPDEQKWWCKRSWTIAGYDAAEMKARNYPRVEPPAFAQIPCWQTCWEGMEPDADTCLKNDAPPPSTGTPGPSCKTTVHCSPTCSTSRFPSLPKFWDQWAADRATLLGGMTFPKLNVTGGPTGAGG